MGIPKSIQDFAVTEALPYVSGTADRTGAIIDMIDFRGIFVVVQFLAIHDSCVTTLKWQHDSDVAGGTMADLLGTGISVAGDDDGQIFILDLWEPVERFVRLYVDKNAANAIASWCRPLVAQDALAINPNLSRAVPEYLGVDLLCPIGYVLEDCGLASHGIRRSRHAATRSAGSKSPLRRGVTARAAA